MRPDKFVIYTANTVMKKMGKGGFIVVVMHISSCSQSSVVKVGHLVVFKWKCLYVRHFDT